MLSAGKSRRNAGSYSLNRSKQSGIVMVIGMIAMVALLAMAGLAMDSGHMLINKTRLQNTADAAALNAAKVYDLTSNIGDAQTAVTTAINLNGDMPGQKEMKDAIADGTISVSTQFSNTLVPFVPTLTPGDAWFVRVTMTNFRMPAFLVRVVGVNTLTVAASAVAGPSPPIVSNVCDIAPVMLCGDALDPPSDNGTPNDPSDDTFWGYSENDIDIVKYGAGANCKAGEDCVGPGNFQLIRLPGNTGGADLRLAAAGRYDPNDCVSAGDPIETEPGNTVGPTVQGFNTRFGQYQGPVSADEFPGDCDSTTMPNPLLTYEDKDGDGVDEIYYGATPIDDLPGAIPGDFNQYEQADSFSCIIPADGPSPKHRRLFPVPIGRCDGTTNGQGTVPILGFACIYLVQPVIQKGNEAHVYIQLREECTAEGSFSMNPTNGPEPTKIIIYKDPNRVDS